MSRGGGQRGEGVPRGRRDGATADGRPQELQTGGERERKSGALRSRRARHVLPLPAPPVCSSCRLPSAVPHAAPHTNPSPPLVHFGKRHNIPVAVTCLRDRCGIHAVHTVHVRDVSAMYPRCIRDVHQPAWLIHRWCSPCPGAPIRRRARGRTGAPMECARLRACDVLPSAVCALSHTRDSPRDPAR